MSLNLQLTTSIYTPQSSFPWKTSTYNNYLCNFELYRRVNKSLHHVCHGMKGITATCSIYRSLNQVYYAEEFHQGSKSWQYRTSKLNRKRSPFMAAKPSLGDNMATEMHASNDTIMNIS